MAERRQPGDQAGRPSSKGLAPSFAVNPSVAEAASVYENGQLVSAVARKGDPPTGTVPGTLPNIHAVASSPPKVPNVANSAMAVRRRLLGRGGPASAMESKSAEALQQAREARSLSPQHIRTFDGAFRSEDADYRVYIKQRTAVRRIPRSTEAGADLPAVTSPVESMPGEFADYTGTGGPLWQSQAERRAMRRDAQLERLRYRGARPLPQGAIDLGDRTVTGWAPRPAMMLTNTSVPLRQPVGNSSPGTPAQSPARPQPPPRLADIGDVALLETPAACSPLSSARARLPPIVRGTGTMGSNISKQLSAAWATNSPGKANLSPLSRDWTDAGGIDAVVSSHFHQEQQGAELATYLSRNFSCEAGSDAESSGDDASGAEEQTAVLPDGTALLKAIAESTTFTVTDAEVDRVLPPRVVARAVSDFHAQGYESLKQRFVLAQSTIEAASSAPVIGEEAPATPGTDDTNTPVFVQQSVTIRGLEDMDEETLELFAENLRTAHTAVFTDNDNADQDPPGVAKAVAEGATKEQADNDEGPVPVRMPLVNLSHWRDVMELRKPTVHQFVATGRRPAMVHMYVAPPPPTAAEQKEKEQAAAARRATAAEAERARVAANSPLSSIPSAIRVVPKAPKPDVVPDPQTVPVTAIIDDGLAAAQLLETGEYHERFQRLLGCRPPDAETALEWGLRFEALMKEFSALVGPVVQAVILERYTDSIASVWPKSWDAHDGDGSLPDAALSQRTAKLAGAGQLRGGRGSFSASLGMSGSRRPTTDRLPAGSPTVGSPTAGPPRGWTGRMKVKIIGPRRLLVGGIVICLSVDALLPQQGEMSAVDSPGALLSMMYSAAPAAVQNLPFGMVEDTAKGVAANIRGCQAAMVAGVPGLHLPLSTGVEFLGVTTAVTAIIPLKSALSRSASLSEGGKRGSSVALPTLQMLPGEETIVYGRTDPNGAFHFTDDGARMLAARTATALNLATQRVPARGDKPDGAGLDVYGPVDAQLHKSDVDGRYYYINLAQMLPPDTVARRPPNVSGATPFRLRAEHVAGSVQQLPPDAATDDVERWSKALRDDAVAALAKELPDLMATASVGFPFNVKPVLHSRGVNLRCLGRLLEAYLDDARTGATGDALPQVVTHIAVEIVARTFESVLRAETVVLVDNLTRIPQRPPPPPEDAAGESMTSLGRRKSIAPPADKSTSLAQSVRAPRRPGYALPKSKKQRDEEEAAAQQAHHPPPPPPPPPQPSGEEIYTAVSQLAAHLFNTLLMGNSTSRDFWLRTIRPAMERKYPCAADLLGRLESLSSRDTIRLPHVCASTFHGLLMHRAAELTGTVFCVDPLRNEALRSRLGCGRESGAGVVPLGGGAAAIGLGPTSSPFASQLAVAYASSGAVVHVGMIQRIRVTTKTLSPPAFCRCYDAVRGEDLDEAEQLYLGEIMTRSLSIGEAPALAPMLEALARIYDGKPARVKDALNMKKRAVLIFQTHFMRGDLSVAPGYVQALVALGTHLTCHMDLEAAERALQTAVSIEKTVMRQAQAADAMTSSAAAAAAHTLDPEKLLAAGIDPAAALMLRIHGVEARLALGDVLVMRGSLAKADGPVAVAGAIARELYDGRQSLGATLQELLARDDYRRRIAMLVCQAALVQSRAAALLGRMKRALDLSRKGVTAMLASFSNSLLIPGACRDLSNRNIAEDQATSSKSIGALLATLAPSTVDERVERLAVALLRFIAVRVEGPVFLGNLHACLAVARQCVVALEQNPGTRPEAIRGIVTAVLPLMVCCGDIKGARAKLDAACSAAKRLLETVMGMTDDTGAGRVGVKPRPHVLQLLLVECLLAQAEMAMPPVEIMRHAPATLEKFNDECPTFSTSSKPSTRYGAATRAASEAINCLKLAYDNIGADVEVDLHHQGSGFTRAPLFARAACAAAEAALFSGECSLAMAAQAPGAEPLLDLLIVTAPHTGTHFVDAGDDRNSFENAARPIFDADMALNRAVSLARAAMKSLVSTGDAGSHLFVRVARVMAWLRLTPLRDALYLPGRLAQRQRAVTAKMGLPPPDQGAYPEDVLAAINTLGNMVRAVGEAAGIGGGALELADKGVSVADAQEQGNRLLRDCQADLFRAQQASDSCMAEALADYASTGLIMCSFIIQRGLRLSVGTTASVIGSEASALSDAGLHRQAAGMLQLALLMRAHSEFEASAAVTSRSAWLIRHAYPQAGAWNPGVLGIIPMMTALARTTTAGSAGDAIVKIKGILECESRKMHDAGGGNYDDQMDPSGVRTATPAGAQMPAEQRLKRLRVALAQLTLYISISQASSIVGTLAVALNDFRKLYPSGASAASGASIQHHNALVQSLRAACRLLEINPLAVQVGAAEPPETSPDGTPRNRVQQNIRRLQNLVTQRFSNPLHRRARLLAAQSTATMALGASVGVLGRAAMPSAAAGSSAAQVAASDLAAKLTVVAQDSASILFKVELLPDDFAGFGAAQEGAPGRLSLPMAEDDDDLSGHPIASADQSTAAAVPDNAPDDP